MMPSFSLMNGFSCFFLCLLFTCPDHLGPPPTKTPIWSGDTDCDANLRTCTIFHFSSTATGSAKNGHVVFQRFFQIKLELLDFQVMSLQWNSLPSFTLSPVLRFVLAQLAAVPGPDLFSECDRLILSWKPRQHFFFQRCPRVYWAQQFSIMTHDQVEASGHACRCGVSSFLAWWYLIRFKCARNSRVDDVSCLWGWLDTLAS